MTFINTYLAWVATAFVLLVATLIPLAIIATLVYYGVERLLYGSRKKKEVCKCKH